MKTKTSVLNGKLLVLVSVGLVGSLASAETWCWKPPSTTKVAWDTTSCWTNSTGATGVPELGDTSILGLSPCGEVANVCNNGAAGKAQHEIRFAGNYIATGNQGVYMLLGGGNGLIWEHKNKGVKNHWSGITIVGSGETPVWIAEGSTFACQKNFGTATATGYPGNDGQLLKQGKGRLVAFNQAGNTRVYSIPVTRIQAGSLDITTPNIQQDIVIGFDGDDDSQRLTYCYGDSYSYDLTIDNGGIFETNGVNNTTHGISSARDYQLALTGTPKFNPMVFSGQFYTKAGLRWSPSSGDSTFVCSNAVSTTTGSLKVEKGTLKLVTGASFTKLGLLSVSAGATFRVDEGAGASFHADSLVLGDRTAVVSVGEGVSLAMTAATLDGTALSPATYTADGANGTKKADWVVGEGSVTVETGPLAGDTWTGAGADTSVATAANWDSLAAPDLAAGDFLATFASGGAAATLPAGTAAKFDGLVLNSAPGGAFAFTAGDGASAEVGASALTVSPAASAATWTMGWPITLANAQTWTVGAGNTLVLASGVHGSSALTFDNAGIVDFAGASTQSAALTLPNGTYRVSASNALGAGLRTVSFDHKNATLSFANAISLDSPIASTQSETDPKEAHVKFEAGSDVTFNGAVSIRSNVRFEIGENATATFGKGLSFPTDGMHGGPFLYGKGKLVIAGTRMSCGQHFDVISGNPVIVRFEVANNDLCGSYWADIAAGGIEAGVKDIFDSNCYLYLSNSAFFDLGGFDQRVHTLACDSGLVQIKSDTPAKLVIQTTSVPDLQGGEHGGTNRVCKAVFAGGAGLRKEGAWPFALGATSSTTGVVEVAQGQLTMTSGGVWPNCAAVTVSGGTLKLQNAQAFSSNAVWSVASAAKVTLDNAGTNVCERLYVDGKRKSGGVYGAIGSGAPREVSWMTGAGFLQVAEHGLTLILK